jgi:hypothetical protein
VGDTTDRVGTDGSGVVGTLDPLRLGEPDIQEGGTFGS